MKPQNHALSTYSLLLLFWLLLFKSGVVLAEVNECKKHVVVGDLHGTLAALIDYLRDPHVDLIDEQGNWKSSQQAKETCLVILGDVIDRGPHSLETYDYLTKLRQQSQGKVIQLIGNHELVVLENDPAHIRSIGGSVWLDEDGNPTQKLQQFRKRLQDDLYQGHLKASYYLPSKNLQGKEDGYVLTHAGVSAYLCSLPQFSGLSPQKLVELFNQSTKVVYNQENPSLNLDMQVLTIPFGPHDNFGITWFRAAQESPYCDQFHQIKGHDIVAINEVITSKSTGKRVHQIDIGAYRGEEFRQCLVIHQDRPPLVIIHDKVEENQKILNHILPPSKRTPEVACHNNHSELLLNGEVEMKALLEHIDEVLNLLTK